MSFKDMLMVATAAVALGLAAPAMAQVAQMDQSTAPTATASDDDGDTVTQQEYDDEIAAEEAAEEEDGDEGESGANDNPPAFETEE